MDVFITLLQTGVFFSSVRMDSLSMMKQAEPKPSPFCCACTRHRTPAVHSGQLSIRAIGRPRQRKSTTRGQASIGDLGEGRSHGAIYDSQGAGDKPLYARARAIATSVYGARAASVNCYSSGKDSRNEKRLLGWIDFTPLFYRHLCKVGIFVCETKSDLPPDSWKS